VIILLAIVFSVLSPILFKYVFQRYRLEEEIA